MSIGASLTPHNVAPVYAIAGAWFVLAGIMTLRGKL